MVLEDVGGRAFIDGVARVRELFFALLAKFERGKFSI